MLSRTGAAGAQSLPAPAAPNLQRNAGPLQRVLEGLPLPPNKATQVTWHCLTARRRAAPTSNETQRQTKRQDRMLPPAQRRNASVRGGDCHRDTGAVHEAVQLSHGSYGPDRRVNEGLFKRVTGRTTSSRPARLPNSPSNGEVEGPHRSARMEPRANNVFQRPRRQTRRASRPTPSIVRHHAQHT